MKYLLLFTILIQTIALVATPTKDHGKLIPYETNGLQDPDYPDHTLWQFLLQQYVDDTGQVDYSGLLKEKHVLESYVNILKEKQPSGNWSRNAKLSYYINLYNSYTVLLILDNYPTSSIKKINQPWDQKLIPLGDNMISLGDLEHEILRKMDEPRIHFAINCASASCPKLLNEVYLPETLDEQLERATYEFIESDRNRIEKDHLELSKIFKWYKNDFLDGDIRAYINTYTNVNIAEDAKVSYLEYDWNLNGR